MKFHECGQIYKLNSDNLISNNLKNIKIKTETSDVLSYVIDSVFDIFDVEPNSVYLRGSCVDRSLSDSSVIDLDLIFVFDDDQYYQQIYKKKTDMSFCSFPYLEDENKMIIAKEQKTIEDQILSRFGKHIEIDIDMFSEEIFLDDIIKRFYSKKIYGSGKDFSLSELSEDTLLDISENDVLPHRKELCLKKLTKLKNFLYMKSSFECNLRNRLTKSLIKLFLRKYSFDLLLKEKSFSKDVYYCFNSIEKNYSEHSVYLREILDLFLNTDSYSDGDVRLLLSKLEYLIYEFELDKS